MQITKKRYELTKLALAQLVTQGGELVKNMPDGMRVTVGNIVEYSTDNDDGTTTDILAFEGNAEDGTRKWYMTNSKTFKREINKILDIFGDDEFCIVKISGTTKSGRVFVTCTAA